MMLVIGLTGDVGAGKSTVSSVWCSLGATLIDADAVAKSQWLRAEIKEAAAARWGNQILRGEGVNFAAIAAIAFQDENEYRFMTELIHPGTLADMARQVACAGGFVVVEIPLLFEVGRCPFVDHVVYVTSSLPSRIERNRRRGWADGEIARRESFLLPSIYKLRHSDLVIENDATLDELIGQATAAGREFLAMASVRELSLCCSSTNEAEAIAEALVGERLAACCNIYPVSSIYRFRDQVERESEVRLLCKTTEARLSESMRVIRRLHSYELPAITVQDMRGADAGTLSWIAASCRLERTE